MTIDDVIEHTIGLEGNYSNHPQDRGGPTRFGIIEKTARAYGYKGDMKVFPRELAKEIYLAQYFLEPHFDRIATVSEPIAAELFDTSVNCGTGFTKPLIQQALNLLNREQADYKDIVEDGIIGNGTVAALKAYIAKRGAKGEAVMVKLLNIMQGARYIEITKARPANELFLTGWLENRIKM